MPVIAKELAEVSIRRLTHTHNVSGEPYKDVHRVGGGAGLYLQCLQPSDSRKAGVKSWLYRMELTTEQALQKGVISRNSGNLQEAERVYRAILQSEPLHPYANHQK